MATWATITRWLYEVPYNNKHTADIIEHLRSGEAWEWQPFDAFFNQVDRSGALAAITIKDEFLRCAMRLAEISLGSDTNTIGIAHGSTRAFTTMSALRGTLETLTHGSGYLKGKKFFGILSELRAWSYRCMMCGGSNAMNLWYTTAPKPVFKGWAKLRFKISQERFESIASEFGWDAREYGMICICVNCRHSCEKCGDVLNENFDVQEIREFIVSRECLLCGRQNLARVEYPKPNRNTWKAIARRKDLMP